MPNKRPATTRARLLEERIAYQNEFLRVYEDVIELARGDRLSQIRIAYHSNPPGVVIIPRLPDDKLLLLRIYRHAFRSDELEFPRGTARPEESAEAAAVRELSEETALEVANLQRLGVLRPDTAILMTEATVFLADLGAHPEASFRPAAVEGILSFELLTLPEIWERVARGAIRDGFTLGALALLTSGIGPPWRTMAAQHKFTA